MGSVFDQSLAGVIFATGLPLNLLVIYVIIRSPGLKTPTNFYIFNLAVADAIYLSTFPIAIVYWSSQRWRYGENFCKTYMSLRYVDTLTKPIFLFILSLSRYLSVCKPQIKLQSPVEAKLVSCGAWIIAAAQMAPIFIFAKGHSFISDWHTCWMGEFDWYYSKYWHVWYPLSLGYAIPLVLFILLTIPVVRKTGTMSSTTKTVLAINIVFFLGWMPYWAIQIYAVLYHKGIVTYSGIFVLTRYTIWIGWLLSVINPIIYAIFLRDFRNKCKAVVTCKGQSTTESDNVGRCGYVNGVMGEESFALNVMNSAP